MAFAYIREANIWYQDRGPRGEATVLHHGHTASEENLQPLGSKLEKHHHHLIITIIPSITIITITKINMPTTLITKTGYHINKNKQDNTHYGKLQQTPTNTKVPMPLKVTVNT